MERRVGRKLGARDRALKVSQGTLVETCESAGQAAAERPASAPAAGRGRSRDGRDGQQGGDGGEDRQQRQKKLTRAQEKVSEPIPGLGRAGPPRAPPTPRLGLPGARRCRLGRPLPGPPGVRGLRSQRPGASRPASSAPPPPAGQDGAQLSRHPPPRLCVCPVSLQKMGRPPLKTARRVRRVPPEAEGPEAGRRRGPLVPRPGGPGRRGGRWRWRWRTEPAPAPPGRPRPGVPRLPSAVGGQRARPRPPGASCAAAPPRPCLHRASPPAAARIGFPFLRGARGLDTPAGPPGSADRAPLGEVPSPSRGFAFPAAGEGVEAPAVEPPTCAGS
eukprot:XP_022261582.1 collagen alpha-1(I) chain-like [Canis lupus familiaris]